MAACHWPSLYCKCAQLGCLEKNQARNLPRKHEIGTYCTARRRRPKTRILWGCKSNFFVGVGGAFRKFGALPSGEAVLEKYIYSPAPRSENGAYKTTPDSANGPRQKKQLGFIYNKKGETAALCFLTPAQKKRSSPMEQFLQPAAGARNSAFRRCRSNFYGGWRGL